MSELRFSIPLPVLERQRAASNPASSAWVSANAGSGKTYVLTQRVLRLLLAGAAPSAILCLTFTKSAAANMAAKVFDALAAWTRLDDAALSARIVELGAEPPSIETLAFARRLFARAIETPGGLKIQTIHAFCERVLHLFPFEANVAAGFRVADESEADLLHERARADAFIAAFATPRGEAAIDLVAREAGADGFDALIGEALKRRATLDAIGDGASYEALLRRRLGLGPRERGETVRKQILALRWQWAEWAKQLEDGGANDAKLAANLKAAIASADDDARSVEAYLSVFFTSGGRGEPRGGDKRGLVTQPLAKRQPDLQSRLAMEQDRLIPLRDRLRNVEAVERSVALYTIAEAALGRYAELKGARGLLDYDDLIARTRTLLARADASWVLYKLDAAVEHILVDEAQDTSPAQWEILGKLCEEFLSGAGAIEKPRTIFAVGDEKQSIFSFQGAAPGMFSRQRRIFEAGHGKVGLPFVSAQLLMSFRSAPAVLASVDRVFAIENAWRDLTGEAMQPPPHEALRVSLPGLVEFWPPIAGEKAAERENWRMPVDAPGPGDPATLHARRIADVIAEWVSNQSSERIIDIETGATRRIVPGDVMILVRSRGAFFEAMIRALKEREIATAGADRLTLNESLAVMDLVVAGRAALRPEDDLVLATALRSPLIGLCDDDLLQIAPNRAGALLDALEQAGETRFALAREKLQAWRRRASEQAPFAFYATLLGADGGRRALLERLGPEAADPIDEFMALALAHERRQAPSLTDFLAEIEAAQTPIKRDMEARGGGVRVMTVHGAKGLEAPIVFLPDTSSTGYAHHTARVIDLADGDDDPAPPFVWANRKAEDSQAIAAARERGVREAAGEHRRLLYVAMTRAAQRLIVSGHYGVKGPDADNWRALMEAGHGDVWQPVPAPWNAAQTVYRIGAAPSAGVETAARSAAQITVWPSWLGNPARQEMTSEPLKPSRAAAPADRDEASRARRQAGVLVHALLQRLPEVAPAGRREAAKRFIAVQGATLDSATRAELVERALSTLAHPELAPLFAPGSRGEVAIGGALAREGRPALTISGRIDRLAIAADAVHLAEFKNSARPRGANPPDYVAQLALYRAALSALYADRPIRASLVWLASADAVEIEAAELDAALAERLAAS